MARDPAYATSREMLALYPVAFPDELFQVWELATSLSPDEPRGAFAAVGIQLCGPFDLLAGEHLDEARGLPISLHWRYFLDPPEMFTVATGDSDGLHWGYWFDETNRPSAVAHYWARDAYEITGEDASLFGALAGAVDRAIESDREYMLDDPDYADEYRQRIDRATALRQALVRAATSHGAWPPRRSARRIAVPTRDGMGLVVPASTLGDPPLDGVAIDRRAQAGECTALLAEAEDALAQSLPGRALRLARPVWTIARCERSHVEAAETLARAYEALDRRGLATVVRSHQAHREIESIDLTVR